MSQITGSGILLLTKINSKIHIILYRGTYKKKYEDLGGSMDPGEDIFQTAAREVYEESATYIKFKPEDLYNSDKIILDRYITFVKIIKNFNIEKGMNLLQKYKDKKYYNEMDDIKIIDLDQLMISILNKNPILPLRNRLIEILYKLYQIPAKNI